MSLSADEITAAKKAFAEMRSDDAARVTLIFVGGTLCVLVLFFGFLLVSGTPVVEGGKSLKGWVALPSILRCFATNPGLLVSIILIGQFFSYRRLKPKYPDNQKVIEEIERKHASELPYGLEAEIEFPKPSKGKRALLWRLDAFLSRKKVTE